MDNIANNMSAPSIHSINDKLDLLLANMASLAERQQVNDNIMMELVIFFQRFQKDVIENQQLGIQELRSHSRDVISSASQLAEASLKHAEGIARCLQKNEQFAANQFHALRQLTQVGLRKLPLASSRIRCVFLVHAIESWDAQIDVYFAMLADDRFEPVVVSINRSFPGDIGYSGEAAISRSLDELDIKHVRIGTQDFNEAQEILRYLTPDVIFRQSHWDADYPLAFRTPELGFTRLCVVPYGMSIVQKFSHSETLPLSISPMAFDQQYHRSAWRIFCETEQTRAYFQRFQHSDPDKFVLSGYPKHERLMKSIGTGEWPIADEGGKRYRVIWAPHHSLDNDWLGFGVFHMMYMDMLNFARRAPHIQFVLKPHPALFVFVVEKKLLTKAQFDDFLQRWQALANCTVAAGQYGALFAASDLMLTDGLSFLTEYQLFDKPLVFIDSRRHVPFNALGELAVQCADSVTGMAEIEKTVLEYAAGKTLGHHDERARLRKMLLPDERPSVEIIINTIAEGFGKET